MSLEQSFRRLVLSRSPTTTATTTTTTICNQCRRRTFATSIHRRQRQNATAAFAQELSAAAATTPPADRHLSSASPTGQTSFASDIVKQVSASRGVQQNAQRIQLDQERGWSKTDLERQMIHRRWKQGDVYAPHDLTGAEMAKWKKLRRKDKPKHDVLDQLNINPLHHYKNFSIMSEYMTEIGRIKHSNETNLRPVNQRKMAKAIRRAIGLGILMPATHKHPELLRKENLDRSRRILP